MHCPMIFADSDLWALAPPDPEPQDGISQVDWLENCLCAGNSDFENHARSRFLLHSAIKSEDAVPA